MLDGNLITIPISKLKPGMLIHRIGKQSGRLVVKNRGRLVHPTVIRQLMEKGVETVVVEKQATRSSKPITRFMPSHTAKNNAPAHTDITSSAPTEENKRSLADQPYENAEKLLNELKASFKSIASRLRKDLPVETSYLDNVMGNVYNALSENKDAMLFVTMFKKDDNYLYGHAVRCAILMCFFGKALGYSETDCRRLATIGLLFDIGMLSIPRTIRNRPGYASVDEQLIIQTHVFESLSLLEHTDLDNEQMLAIEQHHERLDGSGYPYSIEGENIHRFARMLAIVDCFDAMTSVRDHQKPVTPAAALKLLCNADHGYDQKLAVQFLRSIGIYPCGSGVVLDNGELAIVTEVQTHTPLKPKIQSVYCLKTMRHLSPKQINLSELDGKTAIKKPILLKQFGIDSIAQLH